MKKLLILLLVLILLIISGCETPSKKVIETPELIESQAEQAVDEYLESSKEKSCSDECTDPECVGLIYYSCEVAENGCKDRKKEGLEFGKCGVECEEDSNCKKGMECENYKCIEKEIVTTKVTESGYELEMTIQEIFDTFTGLTDIQYQEKLKEFKGKRIKTSMRAGEISKATLSSNYVVLDYPYLPAVKAFFPEEEKEKLLAINIGETIAFTGEFVSYRGRYSLNKVEFTNSKFIRIE